MEKSKNKLAVRAHWTESACELDTVGKSLEMVIPIRFTMYTNELEGRWCWIIVNASGEEQLLSNYVFSSCDEAYEAGERMLKSFGDWMNGHTPFVEEDDQ